MTARREGRVRLLLVAGALLALVACALPWGGTPSSVGTLPSVAYGFDGPGILVFVAAAAVLALLALPYAVGRPVPPLDGALALLVPVALGVVGVAVRAVQLAGFAALGLPDRSPGLWLAAVGVVLMAVGAASLLPERPAA
jgi:hypothetical protein